MEKGEYYYTLLIEPLQCCVSAFICPVDKIGIYWEFKTLDFWNIWKDYPDPHSTFPGPIVEAGFYVNMDLRLLILFDDKTKKELKRVEIKQDWKIVSPAVYFKHVVSISILSHAFKGKPEWLVI